MQGMEEIYQQYARTVYGYLVSRTRDGDLAEELTQETFYQAIRTIDRFDGSCRLSTWLCAIARNVLLTYRRKHPVTEELTEELSERRTEGISAEEDALGNLGRMEMLRRLHALPDPAREVMYLRVFGGLSFEEIGEIHGKSGNWARVTYFRTRERLRKERKDDENSM